MSKRKSKAILSSDSSDSDSDARSPSPPPREKTTRPKKKRLHTPSSSEPEDDVNDNVVRDEEDKQRLMNMTEMEREQELFQRMERLEAEKKRAQIQRKLNKQKKEQSSSALLSEDEEEEEPEEDDDSDEDEYTQKNVVARSRARKEVMDSKKDKKRDALKDLKAQREEKKAKDAEKAAREVKKVDEIFTDSESNSDSGKSSRSSRSSPRRESEEARLEALKRRSVETKDDIHRIKLSRDRLARWLHMPHFSETVIGCFVKVGIGNNTETQRPVYRVAQIVSVEQTAKIYQVNCANARLNTRTNKGLRLRHANADRVYRLEFISNQPFSDAEFSKWKEAMGQNNMALPTVQDVETKVDLLLEANKQELTDADIEKIVEEKSRFRRDPTNFVFHKEKLLKKKEEAEAAGDECTVARLEEELEDVEMRSRELEYRRNRETSNIVAINQRNREQTAIDVEKAMLREADERRRDGTHNPFTRRSSRPQLVVRTSKSADAAGPSTIEETPEKPEDDKKVSPPKPAEGLPRISTADSLHNFDIEIELNVGMSSTVGPQASAKLPSTSTSSGFRGRSLNLDDYKRKRGLI